MFRLHRPLPSSSLLLSQPHAQRQPPRPEAYPPSLRPSSESATPTLRASSRSRPPPKPATPTRLPIAPPLGTQQPRPLPAHPSASSDSLRTCSSATSRARRCTRGPGRTVTAPANPARGCPYAGPPQVRDWPPRRPRSSAGASPLPPAAAASPSATAAASAPPSAS